MLEYVYSVFTVGLSQSDCIPLWSFYLIVVVDYLVYFTCKAAAESV